MKLVIGLGNPEPDYTNTRHNIGKDFLNFYINHNNIEGFKVKHKLKCSITKSENAIYAKPECFMNESGEAVSIILSYFKIDLKDLCIIYDELDLVTGESKLSFGSGSKIHNGIDSITTSLKSNDFYHFRIGVRESKIPMSVKKYGYDPKTYVLAKFAAEDLDIIKNSFHDKLSTIMQTFLQS